MLNKTDIDNIIGILDARISYCKDRMEFHTRGDWGQTYYLDQIKIAEDLKLKLQPVVVS